MFEHPLLGIHGHSAVIAHMLMCARCDIEKGGLAAVGITHQRYTNLLSTGLGKSRHLTLEKGLIRLDGRQVFPFGEHLLCLRLAYHLDFLRLLATEGYPVSYDFILDGVSQRGIKNHLDLIAFDKPHFDYPLTESTVTVHLDDHTTLTCL